MRNKEFDLEKYDHQHYHDDEGCGSEMTDHLFGDFVRHEEHLTTVQLVADEFINFYSTMINTTLEVYGTAPALKDKLIKDSEFTIKKFIQSKFTAQIWEGEKV